MRLFKYLLFSLFACNIASCQWGVPGKKDPTVTKDTLAYTYKTIKQRADDCGIKPDSACTVADISYPAFNSKQVLNDTITKSLSTLFGADDKPGTSLQQYVTHFFKLYNADKTSNDRPGMFYTLDLKANVIRQDSGLVTLQIIGYTYQGGAHGSSIKTFINWYTKADKELQLKDILTDGYEKKLNAVAGNIFRNQENLSDTASLKGNYFFKDNKFSLNDNYLITPIGIRFLYNEYEIKPYAAGQTELLIPYSQIKSLLRPNTVITQYLK